MKTTTTLHVWADIRCPWCWIGHRNLAEAIRRSGAQVRVEHHSFLLEPHGPGGPPRPIAEVATSDWGLSQADWTARRDKITRAGQAADLAIDIDRALTIDSRNAHRLLKAVTARGLDTAAAWDSMFAAHLRDNLNLEDWGNLARIGSELGLDHEAIRAVAESDVFDAEVTADHEAAQADGIRTIPTVVGGAQRLSGAQTVADLQTFIGATAAAVA